MSLSVTELAFAESKIAKKIWGDKDCSKYSTNTFSGLSDYVKCKKGLEPSNEENVFKSLNATIPEEKDPTELSMDDALILIEKRKEYDKNKKKKKDRTCINLR